MVVVVVVVVGGGGVRGARAQVWWAARGYREGCGQAAASPALEQVGLDRGAAPGERAGIGKEVVTVCAPARATLAPQENRAESSAHAPTGAAASASLSETHSQVRKPGVGVR